jgi:hypothetical protein
MCLADQRRLAALECDQAYDPFHILISSAADVEVLVVIESGAILIPDVDAR